jgi:hypothetical protein
VRLDGAAGVGFGRTFGRQEAGAQALQPTAYKGHLDPRPRLGRFGFHELELDTFK